MKSPWLVIGLVVLIPLLLAAAWTTEFEWIKMFNEGPIVFNEASEDIDFRVETDNATDAFQVDAGTDTVQLGAWRSLEIVTTTAQSYSLSSTGKAGLVIQTAGETASMHFMTDLLTAPGPGGYWTVKTGDTNDIVIDTEGSETIDGSATYTIDGALEATTFTTDGTNFFVIGSYLE